MDNEDGAKDILENNLNNNLSMIEQGNETFWIKFENAVIYSILGNRNDAYLWLQKAIDAGWLDYRWAMKDPYLEFISRDQKFADMMERVKLKA